MKHIKVFHCPLIIAFQLFNLDFEMRQKFVCNVRLNYNHKFGLDNFGDKTIIAHFRKFFQNPISVLKSVLSVLVYDNFRTLCIKELKRLPE